ncbi:MAG: signal peptidase I [Phycisphaerales bacterium]|nr:signal peptidase I [Phycisphaerales bacterium]
MSETEKADGVASASADLRAVADPGAASPSPGKWKGRLRKFWREWVKPMLVVVLVLCTFRSAVADWNDVPTPSMDPTILPGDRILVNKLAYDLKFPFTRWHIAEWGGPSRGEIVVFFSPKDETRLVKRVIGLPGDVVELRGNRVLINGLPMEYAAEDHSAVDSPRLPGRALLTENLTGVEHPVRLTPSAPSKRNYGPQRVPDGCYFVMGDNRDNSHDSRWFGCVSRERIIGRSSRVVLSVDPSHYYLPRWGRFFEALP